MTSYAEARARRHARTQASALQLLAERGPLPASEVAVTLATRGHRVSPRGYAIAGHLRSLRQDGLVEILPDGRWSVVAERCAGLCDPGVSVPAWQVEEWGGGGVRAQVAARTIRRPIHSATLTVTAFPSMR